MYRANESWYVEAASDSEDASRSALFDCLYMVPEIRNSREATDRTKSYFGEAGFAPAGGLTAGASGGIVANRSFNSEIEVASPSMTCTLVWNSSDTSATASSLETLLAVPSGRVTSDDLVIVREEHRSA